MAWYDLHTDASLHLGHNVSASIPDPPPQSRLHLAETANSLLDSKLFMPG